MKNAAYEYQELHNSYIQGVNIDGKFTVSRLISTDPSSTSTPVRAGGPTVKISRRARRAYIKESAMSVLEAFLQGVLQGLTEFLPVSSSGHLSLFQYFTGNSGDTGSSSPSCSTRVR